MKSYRFVTALVTAPALFATLVAAHVPGDCRVIDVRDPANHGDDVFACTEENWFHAAEESALGNLADVPDSGVEAHPSWSTDAPSGSFSEGEGGAYVAVYPVIETPALGIPNGGARFVGDFDTEGALDNMAVELYFLPPVKQGSTLGQELPPISGSNLRARLQLDIAGQTFHSEVVRDIPMHGGGASGETPRVRFAFTGLYSALRFAGLDPEASHPVRLTVHTADVSWFTLGFAPDPVVFLYDAVEAPSTLTFNVAPGDLDTFTEVPIG